MKASNVLLLAASTLSVLAESTNKPIYGESTPYFDPNDTQAIHYGILLFPGFQALDVYGPLDILNNLGLFYEFPVRLTVLASKLDAVSSHVKSQMNLTNEHPLTDIEERTVVQRTFADQLTLQSSSTPADPSSKNENIDVLLVPGGIGTRQNMTAEINFVKEIYPSLKAILSVCTGATILSRAGILDTKRATTNKRAWKWATSTGPDVNWVGEARWVVDGNIITSSGVSAGMDATYAFIGMNYGEEVEEGLAKIAEYARWVDREYDPFAHVWNVSEPFLETAPVVEGGCT